MFRSFLSLTLSLIVAGCAAGPSPTGARQPTPGSVTRDKPGGDASFPIDAALERLLAEPLGNKIDRWGTLGVKMPDGRNWKRVRFWNHPLRAGFRYGKDPHIAVGMLSYAPAEDDDSPSGCMKTFIKVAQETASLFDVEVGDVEREVRTHRRGPERVDWPETAAAWEIEKKRMLAERKKKLEARKQTRKVRLERARKRLRQRRAAAKRRAEQKKKAAERAAKQNPSKTIPPSPALPANGTDGGRDGRPKADGAKPTVAPKNESATPDETTVDKSAKADETADDSPPANTPKKREIHGDTPGAPLRRRLTVKRIETRPKPARPRPAPKVRSPEEEALLQKARKARNKRLDALRKLRREQPYRTVPLPKDLPPSEMQVMRTRGTLNTLFKAEDYEVAMVAYESWPGTCLVQGFAVRVGSDRTLANSVVARWLEESAPMLWWAPWLRTAPKFENR